MTGPDHYRRAEELLGRENLEAHVHALLALAAAIAVNTQADKEAWTRVAATMPPPPPPGSQLRPAEDIRPARPRNQPDWPPSP